MLQRFIEKSNKIHNYKYDYSLVEYINCRIKVKIICKIHGIFEQTPEKHLLGRGCSKCSGNNKKTTLEFIEESKNLHADKYDYSLVNYIGAKKTVKIICKKHGIFNQIAYHHINGSGCPKCKFENNKYTIEEIIKLSIEKHGQVYNYDLININDKKLKIICNTHGIFEQNLTQHLHGQGCKKCSDDNRKLSIEDFIKNSNKIHNNEYDYSLVKYINNYTVVKIICNKHGEFEQAPNFHMLGQGCPKCKSSLNEKKILSFLNEKNINYIHQKTFKDCKNKNKLPFDFYLPDYNLCIEYNGKQHYEPIEYFGGQKTLEYIIKNDNIKQTYCKNNNIKLLIIKYDDDIISKITKEIWKT